MPDASIILGVKQPQIQQVDPIDRYGKLLGIKQMQTQSDVAERGLADEEALRGAYQQAGGDSARLRALLQAQGQYKPLQALDKFELDKREKEATIGQHNATAGKADFDVKMQKLEHGASLWSTAKDQPTYEAALRAGVMTGVFEPQLLQHAPKEFNPQFIQAMLSGGMKAADKLKLEQGGANLPFAAGPNGPVPNEPVQAFELKKREAGRPITNVNVSTEKKYGEKFAEGTASQDLAMLDAARKAPDLATRSNQVLEMIGTGKVITGAGADIRLQIGKALKIAGASDAEVIANTELLSTDLARNTLDAIKASGLGAGSGFSNADRDFLEKAVGGKITLEASTIERLATLAHRAAEKTASRWGERAKQIPGDALQGAGVSSDPIQVPSIYKKPAAQQFTRDEIDAELRRRGVVR